MQEIIYFELNNWFAGRDYPDAEPFLSWMSNDLNIKFRNEAWVRKNKLCVAFDFVDMSQNFCVTATLSWVQQNCPSLLTEHKEFLREPDEDGAVYGRFGHKFFEYAEENFGIFDVICEE